MSDLGQRLASLSREERARLFERLKAKGADGGEGRGGGIERRPAGLDRIPLSFAQERLWFLDRLSPGDPSYNMPLAVRIDGALDGAALARALAAVAMRHEPLRTTFADTEGGPVQIVSPRPEARITGVDLGGLPDGRAEAELSRLAREEVARPFDLATGPLLRAVLVALEPGAAVLLLTMHHIASDGWSMGILVRDIGAAYRAAAGGGEPALPPLPIQYADFALWQRRTLTGEALARHVEVWRRRLEDAPAALPLPFDRPRPAVKSSAGATVDFVFAPGAAARLTAVARAAGATLFVGLLTAWMALLSRYTGAARLPIGTPVANRERRETLDLIGFFVNTLVLVGEVGDDPKPGDLLARLRDAAFEAFAHQDLPFEKLVEELKPERDPSRTPLFQVMCSLQNNPMPPADAGALRLTPLPAESRTAKFDLSVSLGEIGDDLAGSLTYSTELFDRATAERMTRHLGALVEAVAGGASGSALRLSQLPMLTPAEKAELAGEAAPPPWEGELIHQRIAARALLHPGRPALACEGEEISYGELARRTAALAEQLAGLGVGPEARVAVPARRSADTVVAILAVLTAGGAYVPLDPDLPEARQAALLEEAACMAQIGAGDIATALPPGPIGPIRQLRPIGPINSSHPENAAYVLFTSGSTGIPKGVVVEHRQLAHYVDAAIARLRLPEGARYALVSTFAADLGHTSLFPALALGGCLDVVAKERVLDPEAFADRAAEHPADCLKIVPSHLAALLSSSRPALALPRERLVLGGEATSRELLARIAELAPGLAVFNHYGPTEATVGAIAGPVEAGGGGPVPLGAPLDRMLVRLLGTWGEPVPPGVTGEIHLGGAGVARGYLGRPDLTAERFVPDPWGPGERLYRTGDLARRLPSGELIWLGRADDQVKVRGFRIEPREVEAVLESHPDVGRAAVLPRRLPGLPGGGPVLVAYAQAARLQEDPAALAALAAALRLFLRERLPAPMVPEHVVLLPRLPLSDNGKVDRRALAALPPPAETAADVEPPEGEVERRLAEVWSEVLGREKIGRHANFFDLGGHSLLLARLQLLLNERLGLSLPLLRLFEFPTVASLAGFLVSDSESEPEAATGSRDRASLQRQALQKQRERRLGSS